MSPAPLCCSARGATALVRLRKFGPLPLLSLLLAACGGIGAGSHSGLHSGAASYVVGPPYQIDGVWYYPRVDYNYDRVGIASWYGESYNGRPTSDGEIYDMNGLTAAHPTLPLPSVVEVTDLQNGRTLRLRVNDRGPFVDGRIIDVSRRAAQLLGFREQGTARVRVKILKRQSIEVAEAAMHNGKRGGVLLAAASPPPAAEATAAPVPPPQPIRLAAYSPPPAARPAPAPPASPPSWRATAPRPPADRQRPSFASLIGRSLLPSAEAAPLRATSRPAAARPRDSRHRAAATARRARGRYYIQAGAFAHAKNAWRVRTRIARLGRVEVTPTRVHGVEYYRVRLGPLASVKEANKIRARVVGRGYPRAAIVTD